MTETGLQDLLVGFITRNIPDQPPARINHQRDTVTSEGVTAVSSLLVTTIAVSALSYWWPSMRLTGDALPTPFHCRRQRRY
jgi:hypothetical protein